MFKLKGSSYGREGKNRCQIAGRRRGVVKKEQKNER